MKTLADVGTRKVLHIQAGSPDWTPSPDELQQLVTLFQTAKNDPLGAIVVTRDGVKVDVTDKVVVNTLEFKEDDRVEIQAEALEDDEPEAFVGIALSEGEDNKPQFHVPVLEETRLRMSNPKVCAIDGCNNKPSMSKLILLGVMGNTAYFCDEHKDAVEGF